MKKSKYTIIYDESKLIGSHMNHITYSKRVETDDLEKLLNNEFGGSVWFVFEGWPNLAGEFNEKV